MPTPVGDVWEWDRYNPSLHTDHTIVKKINIKQLITKLTSYNSDLYSIITEEWSKSHEKYTESNTMVSLQL